MNTKLPLHVFSDILREVGSIPMENGEKREGEIKQTGRDPEKCENATPPPSPPPSPFANRCVSMGTHLSSHVFPRHPSFFIGLLRLLPSSYFVIRSPVRVSPATCRHRRRVRESALRAARPGGRLEIVFQRWSGEWRERSG